MRLLWEPDSIWGRGDAPSFLWFLIRDGVRRTRRHKHKLDMTSLSAAAALGGSAGGD